MAETTLTDALALALAGTTDTETQLVYMTVGQSTYFLDMYRMLQRLLTLAKMPGNQLRVVKDGDLTCAVAPGELQIGMTTYTFAGKTGKALSNNTTNRIYLSAANLAALDDCSVSTDSWATLIATGDIIVPLAEIATGTSSEAAVAGKYDYRDITEYRGRTILAPPGSLAFVVEENTAGVASPNILIGAESGKTISNEGSTATNYNTLPTAVAGLQFTFIRRDATDDLRVTAAASDKIVYAGTSTKAAGYIESTAQWDHVTLRAVDEEYWVAVAHDGAWTVETS